jgi:hypothetical protein
MLAEDSATVSAGSAQRLRDLFTPPPPTRAPGAVQTAHPALVQNMEPVPPPSQGAGPKRSSSSAKPKPELNPYSLQQLDRMRQ